MDCVVKHKGICDYADTWRAMKEFTRQRSRGTADEIWILQHHPVYTQGVSCRDEPDISGSHIPVVHSDRGGQITYHGPGQLISYFLIDIKHLKIGPRLFVNKMEELIIEFLGSYGISGDRLQGAPGVYVDKSKIAALGFRISNGCSYHGISINIDMDLRPYNWINPCGMEGLSVTQIQNYVDDIDYAQAANRFETHLNRNLKNLYP